MKFKALEKFLQNTISRGRLTLINSDTQRYVFGEPATDHPEVTVRFLDDNVARELLADLQLGAGEAYMDGRMVIDEGDVMELIRLIHMNQLWEKGGQIDRARPLDKVLAPIIKRVKQFNFRSRARRNTAHHYDLSRELYEHFLDEDMQYSCAYFIDSSNTLEQAQLDKKSHIAAKLALQPEHRVLDIGCGWGGMALYLHAVSGAEILGVTLSQEQLKVARERAAISGVTSRVKFELLDYRDIARFSGLKFDRIVSVGMFEHVGAPYYSEFFRHTANLMTDDGVMLLHTIGRFGEPGSTDAFTTKYIFPGGYIPALSEIFKASQKSSLIATDLETLRLHYALTLRQWYARTTASKDAIVALYDERFYRMWRFYLAGATAGFEYGDLGNYQIQFCRSRHALPICRDYMMGQEQKYGQTNVARERTGT